MKKQLIISVFIFISSLLAYFGFQIYQKIEAKKAFTEQVKHLPKPSVFQWIGKSPTTNNTSTIILFFSPDCEHCQYEAKSIVEQKVAFTNINLWWVSVADSVAIKAFSKTYGLENLPNTYLAHLSAEEVAPTFGSVSVPHIFIYDKNRLLQKEFKGETKVEALLKAPEASVALPPDGRIK